LLPCRSVDVFVRMILLMMITDIELMAVEIDEIMARVIDLDWDAGSSEQGSEDR